MAVPVDPEPHDQRLAEHLAALLRHGGPIDGHEVSAVEPYAIQGLWRVRISAADGAEWMVGPVGRVR